VIELADGNGRGWRRGVRHAIVPAMRRRGLLTLGVVAAAIVAVGGGVLALLEPAWREGRLTARGREVFAGVGQALLEGGLPRDEPAASRAIDALLTRLDATIAALPPHVQAELSQLLALLGSSGGRLALAGLQQPWQHASLAQRQAALQAMRVSSMALRQQAYQALHDLVGSAYFSDPSTWEALGYPGPRRI
jgi:hypothetical protein